MAETSFDSLSPSDARRGMAPESPFPRSPSPSRSIGWNEQGDVPGLEVSFDSIDIREEEEESERDLTLFREDSVDERGCIDGSDEESAGSSILILPPVFGTIALGPFFDRSASTSTSATSVTSRESYGGPSTPISATHEPNLFPLDIDNSDGGHPSLSSIPILLLATARKPHRRRSAPSLSTPSIRTILPFEEGLADMRRASEGHKRSMSLLDRSTKSSASNNNMASVAWEGTGRDSNDHVESNTNRNWSGLKRALSLGSSGSRSSGNHVKEGRTRQRRLSDVKEHSKPRQASQTSSGNAMAISNHHHQPLLVNDRYSDHDGSQADRGPASGPSSPCSPPSLALSDDDRYALDDHIIALKLFPKPPGRALSGFNGVDDEDLDQLQFSLASISTAAPKGSHGVQVVSLSEAKDDSSPTVPNFGDITISSNPARNTHTPSPPSPALTPSPHLSFTDSTLLKTPYTPADTRTRSVESVVGGVEKRKGIPLDYENPRSNECTPSISTTTRGQTTSTLPTLLPSASSSSVPASTANRRTIRHTSKDTLSTCGEQRTMGDEWYSDSDTPYPQPPITTQSIPVLPSSHPFSTKSVPSAPSSARTSLNTASTSNQEPSSLYSPPTSYSQLSRRQSKFTAFSGSSSASSVRSSDSTTSSIRHGHAQHWGLGEKPDISTVFEEEGSISSFDKDNIPPEKDEATLGALGIQAQRDTEHIGLASSVPKDSDPRGTSHQQHDRDQPSPTLPPSTFDPRLNHQDSLSTLVFRPPQPPSASQNRPQRSGTISSEVSGFSTKTNRSAPHPFATVGIRSDSPPIMSSSRSAPTLTTSRSQSNLLSPQLTSAPAHQVQLAESSYEEDGDLCPVCNESLKAEYRLANERPHVISECGHQVHYECFTMCYGEDPTPGSRKAIGVCGVCRRPMRVVGVGMGRKGKSRANKLRGPDDGEIAFGSSDNLFTAASIHSRDRPSFVEPADDPKADDPVMGISSSMSASASSRSLVGEDQPKVVIPTISIRSEFSSISKNNRANKGQFMTTMVTVTVPPAGDRGRYPARSRSFQATSAEVSPQLPPSPRSDSSGRGGPSARPPTSPFGAVVADLQARVPDYTSQGLDAIGPLRLFDILAVRKGSLMRDFNVYLYEEALVCITEEKKSSFSKFFGGSSSKSDSSGKTVTPHSVKSQSSNKGVLKLKGRIYLKHVRYIQDSSKVGELSLTIVMIDEKMDSFVIVFKERGAHGMWKSTLEEIVRRAREQQPLYTVAAPESAGTSRSKKLAQMLGDVPPPLPTAGSVRSDPDLNLPLDHLWDQPATASTSRSRSNLIMSPSTAGYTTDTPATSTFTDRSPVPAPAPTADPADLIYTAPLGPQHTPMDVIVIFSVPAATAGPAQTPAWKTKTKIMRESLSFLLATVGPRDRVSVVSSEHGVDGVIRRTPFLNPTRLESRRRLEAFVDILGRGRIADDEYEVSRGRDERVDVVTAMNVALDAVLQRKAKNPLGAMIVVSDSTENIKRAQMDLVTARLDAANLPVHALGYGKGHDPSPLWMISNHTYGTYTFVREWYDLPTAFAGVLGGLMSVAITSMKLHLVCSDNDYKILRLAGASNSLIHTQGKQCDIELREMRFGETREVLVEVDYTHDSAVDHQGGAISGPSQAGSSNRGSSASGGNNLGIDALSVGDSNNLEAVYDSVLIDEEPVLEVDCSYHDPAINKSVSRLHRPILLTVAILPANAPPSNTPGDPMIIRRRMEALASDMITRSLLIASRRNYVQASKILSQTMNIVRNMTERMRAVHLPLVATSSPIKAKKELAVLQSLEGLSAVYEDLEAMIEGMDEHPDPFERDTRNFAAQQAVVYRLQKSWTMNNETEKIYCVPGSRDMIAASGQWRVTRNVMPSPAAQQAGQASQASG